MRTVGIRDLKNRLSEYLRLVRAGEEILITDRDEIVAEISLPRPARVAHQRYPRLSALVREGKATPGGRNSARLYPRLNRILRSVTSAQLLKEERGER